MHASFAEARIELTAPEVSGTPLPEWPRTWYIVARSSEISRGVIHTVRMGERECVIFRTQSGALAALDAHCPHMGAHLRHGTVTGDAIRCALHGWRIGADGAVRDNDTPCSRATTWRVEEHFGLVFLHLGEPVSGAVPLPENAGDCAWITGKPVELRTHWHNFVVNSFDLQHLHAVHHRQVLDLPPRLERDSRSVIWTYVSRVTGKSPSDRLMKWLSSDRIRVKMRCFGPIISVDVDLGFTKTAAVLGLLPLEGGVRAFGAFGIRPGPFGRVRLWLTRMLFLAFLRRDMRIIEDMRLRTTEVRDPGVRAVVDLLRSLPEHDS